MRRDVRRDLACSYFPAELSASIVDVYVCTFGAGPVLPAVAFISFSSSTAASHCPARWHAALTVENEITSGSHL